MLDIRVLPGPVWILKEGELVKGCPDIAGCPRVGVVVPGATNLAGRLENGEGNTFLLQLRSNTESTETSAHNKGIVLFNPIHFLSFDAPKPIEDGSKNQGKEKEDDWQREQSGKQGNHCQYEEEGKCPVDEDSIDWVAHLSPQLRASHTGIYITCYLYLVTRDACIEQTKLTKSHS